MTIEEAKEYIPNFEAFRNEAYNRILKCYARNDGEMYKVFRWLKQARI